MIHELSAVELARRLAGGELSAGDVAGAFLERIEALDPALNAIPTLVPERALADAAAADARRARGEPLGPLHGLPIAVKDLADTAGIRTTYGSPIYRDHVPAEDALLVRRLRAAGAIVVGKTNTPEFGAGSHTFNPVFGVTRNPWDTTRSAGGSSGGAAAALAARLLPLADGSDMGGSLRNPASFCNVVGLRPTPGRVAALAEDAWDPLSVSGPMARTVDDLVLLLGALAGPDPRDPLSLAAPGAGDGDRPRRIAWSRDLGGLPVEPAVTAALEPARAVLEELGFEVEDAEPDLAGADEVFETMRGLAFVRSRLADLRAHPELVKETIAWNVEQGRALSPERIARAQVERTAIFRRTAAFLERYDALALPTSQVAPFPVEVEWPREVAGAPMQTYIEWMRSCSRITVTAHPALSLPAGFTEDGLPVGLQLVGRYGDEAGLLRVARELEQATGLTERQPPLGLTARR